VLVLEARSRIGGRCWTRHFPGLSVPAELGAEFIHGRPPVTFALLQRAGSAALDSARTQRFVTQGRLRAIDAFAEARKAMRNTAALKAKDSSFATFLARKRGLSRRTRSFARMMVEGFDAADPSRASARAIVEEWCASPQLGAQFRPAGGYGALLDSLTRGDVRLQSVVREIRWERGSVEVRGERLGTQFRYRAPQAIVTLPLGVLQSRAVRFIPDLKEKRQALKKLAAGSVVKIALRFRRAFWEEGHPEVAFFHAPAAAFPTFWTPLPMRAPFLIGWAGGPKAVRLAGLKRDEVVRRALDSLKSIFGRQGELLAIYAHDWQADPYARGAYSYVTVGGEGAREALQAPLADTLHFAGEATDTQGEAGTVAGALQTGLLAARRLA
jgi:monoamine oxidase